MDTKPRPLNNPLSTFGVSFGVGKDIWSGSETEQVVISADGVDVNSRKK